jgi:hypothetical protein
VRGEYPLGKSSNSGPITSPLLVGVAVAVVVGRAVDATATSAACTDENPAAAVDRMATAVRIIPILEERSFFMRTSFLDRVIHPIEILKDMPAVWQSVFIILT